MNPHDAEPLLPGADLEPYDPNELAASDDSAYDEQATDELDADQLTDVQFERDYSAGPRHTVRTWWVVGAAAALVVVGMVIGIVVFNASAPAPARGARSAAQAATRFVAAVNAGDGNAAVAISCDTFADEARAAARSGEQGIAFTLDSIRADSKTAASATITEHLTLPGGTKQSTPADVSVLRSSARWLMCGRVS